MSDIKVIDGEDSRYMPGWAGPVVHLKEIRKDGVGEIIATAQMSPDGTELWVDSREYREKWEREGIVGRARYGRVFPKDLQGFLDELPFAYKAKPYLWADPAKSKP